MFYKPLLILRASITYLTLSLCFINTLLMAQNSSDINSTAILPTTSPQVRSNLVTNNPFVPKNSDSQKKTENLRSPQLVANKPQVLQKYLEFKSIAIINDRKYYSIFNKRTNKSFWISEGEIVENFSVTYYDPVNNTISVSDGINTEIIPIIQANETPLSIITTNKKPIKQKVALPKTPEAKANKDNENQKILPRRRVIPVKR